MKIINFLTVLFVFVALVSCNNNGITKKTLENENDTASYALGLDIAKKLKQNFNEVDRDLFIQGVTSGMDSTDILIAPDKVDMILRVFFQKQQQKAKEQQQEEALKKAEEEFGEVKKEGIKFLEENKSKDGVITTASGLQYIIINEGSGDQPTAASRVKVHYHGTLLDGTVFDSSVDRKKPSEFGVGQVIKGWTEGLQLMPVGAKYKFFISQELAYGAFPRRGGKIRPFDALIFEVELLEILK